MVSLYSSEEPVAPEPASITPELLKTAVGLWSHAGESHMIPITGSSMLPTLREGDQVLVIHTRDVRVGQIVVFRSLRGLISHRVLKIVSSRNGGFTFFTKGDHVLAMDSPLVSEDLVGRVVVVRRGLYLLNLDSSAQKLFGKIISRLMRIQVDLYYDAIKDGHRSASFKTSTEILLSRILLRLGGDLLCVNQYIIIGLNKLTGKKPRNVQF